MSIKREKYNNNNNRWKERLGVEGWLKRVIERVSKRQGAGRGGGRGKEGCKQVNGRDRSRRGANEPVGGRSAMRAAILAPIPATNKLLIS